MEEQEDRCLRAGLPQVMMMMMISIALFQKQTELGSIYLEEGAYLGDPAKRLIMKTSKLF